MSLTPRTGEPAQPGLYACWTIGQWKFLRWDGKIWWFDILSAHWVCGCDFYIGPLPDPEDFPKLAAPRSGPADTRMYDL